MQLHALTETRPHSDVPLWTTAEYTSHGSQVDGIVGRVLNYWQEGDIVVGLWESSDGDERFIIHMYEQDWLIPHKDLPFDADQARHHGTWYIWRSHTLDYRP